MKSISLTLALAFGVVTPAFAAEPDILGVRLGMTWAEAKPILEKRGVVMATPLYTISLAADSNLADKYGYPYQINYLIAHGTESVRLSLYPKSIAMKLSKPNNLIVHRVERSFPYLPDKAPSKATTLNNLITKYGMANEALDQKTQIMISWLPLEKGTLDAFRLGALIVNQPTSSHLHKCYNTSDVYSQIDSNPDATSTNPGSSYDVKSWKGWQSCGLVVNVQLSLNNGLTQNISQSIFDFRQFDTVKAAKIAAEKQIKANIIADSNAAAPQKDL